MRGSWKPSITATFWPPLLWASALCLSRSPGLLNRRPRGPLSWLSLLHLIRNFSGPQPIRGPKGSLGLMWLSLPHLVYNSVSNSIWGPEGPFVLVWLSLPHLVSRGPNCNSLTSRSLEWHVWSSSSGNICHAVHRSLSSRASVYECTMGILASPNLFANFRPRYFLS